MSKQLVAYHRQQQAFAITDGINILNRLILAFSRLSEKRGSISPDGAMDALVKTQSQILELSEQLRLIACCADNLGTALTRDLAEELDEPTTTPAPEA